MPNNAPLTRPLSPYSVRTLIIPGVFTGLIWLSGEKLAFALDKSAVTSSKVKLFKLPERVISACAYPRIRDDKKFKFNAAKCVSFTSAEILTLSLTRYLLILLFLIFQTILR